MIPTLAAVGVTMTIVVLVIFLMLAPVVRELAPVDKHVTRTTVRRIRRFCAILVAFLGGSFIIVLLTILVAHAMMS